MAIETVWGLGVGLFFIVLSVVVGVLLCIFAPQTQCRWTLSCGGFFVPILTVLFFMLAPREPVDGTIQEDTDSKGLYRRVLAFLLIAACVVGFIVLTIELGARKIQVGYEVAGLMGPGTDDFLQENPDQLQGDEGKEDLKTKGGRSWKDSIC